MAADSETRFHYLSIKQYGTQKGVCCYAGRPNAASTFSSLRISSFDWTNRAKLLVLIFKFKTEQQFRAGRYKISHRQQYLFVSYNTF